MADYHPLIVRAVDGLGASTGEARRALYERARAALVAQLRAIEPPLSEADITRERLALEDAIRKVEAETVRKARTEPRPPPPPLSRPNPPLGVRPQTSPPQPPVPPRPAMPRQEIPRQDARQDLLRQDTRQDLLRQDTRQDLLRQDTRQDLLRQDTRQDMRPEMQRPDMRGAESQPPRSPDVISGNAPHPAAPPSARDRLLNARTSPISREGLKGLRDVLNEVDDLGPASARSAQSARDTRDSYGTASPQQFFDDEMPELHDRAEPRFDSDEPDLLDEDAPERRSLEPSFDSEVDEPMAPPHFRRPQAPRGREPDDHYEEPRPPRSYRGLAKLAVALLIIAGLTATVSWQWSNIAGLYDFILHMRSRPTQTAQTPAAEPKFPGRVPQDQTPGQAPAIGAPGQQAGPEVAQRVVLYEEDPNDPQGKRLVGSAIWRTDTVSPGSGLAPELEVRADITVPDRNMTVTLTLRRNTDQALPASHTIEIMFNVPPDFPGGGIANVPGVLMKDSEQARGVPLAGLAVKVTNGFFLIGLSAVDTDVQRNMELLKDKPWFDIPVVYNNGGRAILALEKGPPGDRAFADAFAAWGK
jgi:hypothetical protein